MTPYPAQLPKDDMQLVIDAIRSRSFEIDSHRFMKDTWETIGYGLKVQFGELPDAPASVEPIAYPASVPFDEMVLVLNALKSAVTPTAELAKAFWEVAGFGLGQEVGEWSPLPPANAMTGNDLGIEQLEAAIAANQGGGIVGANINWAAIIQLAIQILSAFAQKGS